MSPAEAETPATLWPARPALAWFAAVTALLLVSAATGGFGAAPGLVDLFLREQDLPVALAAAAFLILIRSAPARWAPLDRLAALGGKLRPGPAALGAALLAAAIALAGWFVVMGGYPLSADEFLAGFDARIFRAGRLFATLPPEWRALRLPLQPQYMLLAGDGASWSSAYLPVNAMVQAALGGPVAGAAWLAVSVAALFGIARRLWPDRPDAGLIAVVLLVTSSQFLFGGMTRYAMAPLLALNLVWLWLFLREGRASLCAAVAVGFVAAGLHQVVFHPLFVAPFLLELWLARRWRRAAVFTLAYLAIGLFWLSYWRLFFPHGPAAGADARDIWLVQIRTAFEQFDPTKLGAIAKGLLRFVTWQNPLAAALALLAVPAALRSGPPFRPMLVGMVLLVGLMFFTIPDQGHGWGYRYLHGYIGSACLLAVLGWVRMTQALDKAAVRAASVGFGATAAFSLLVLAPWRASQAHGFIRPYAQAAAAIERAEDVDVVVVDATGMFYAQDLVRNDPFLRNRPKVVDLVVMREPEIQAMCKGRRVAVFDRLSGSGLRPAVYPRRDLERLAENRRRMAELGCGTLRVPAPR